MEVASGAATQFSTQGKYSPAPSISSYSSSEANNSYQQNIPAPHADAFLCTHGVLLIPRNTKVWSCVNMSCSKVKVVVFKYGFLLHPVFFKLIY